MKKYFWRFAYDEARLGEILSSEDLVFPDLSRWPNASNKDKNKIIEKLRVGDYVLLANYDDPARAGLRS